MAQDRVNPHILIIDADASAAYVTRAVVQRVVPDADWTVEHGTAIGLFQIAASPDVVIVDPPHQRLAGLRLIQSLQDVYPKASLVVLASTPTPLLRRDMQRLGIAVYLEKPVPLTELAAALSRFLPSTQLIQANGA